MVDLIEALGTWVEESILRRLQRASVFSAMADECTDITAVEELLVFCHWRKMALLLNPFFLVKYIRDKNLQVGNIVGMGFGGAATFPGKMTGVQARLR